MEEAEGSEESSSVAEWVTVESRSGRGKQKRITVSILPAPPSPLLVEASRFNVLPSEVLEGMQEEKETEKGQENNDEIVTAGETGSAAAATEGDGLVSGETGEPSTQQDMTVFTVFRYDTGEGFGYRY